MGSLAILLLGLQAKSNWNELHQTLKGSNGSHSFQIEITCQNFLPRGRKITWKKDGYNYFPAINGRRTWGFDGVSASDRGDLVSFLKGRAIEVREFKVQVDGKAWRVPASLTFDLLNLDLDAPGQSDHGKATLSADGKTLTLDQDGSDGAGGYRAHFIFRVKGLVERKIFIESEVAQIRKA